MAIYRFRVAFEDYDAVREIDIKSNQTFEDFHYAIHKAINFEPAHSSSFYVSNDQWIKGEELAFMPNERKIDRGVKLMKDFKLSKFIDDPHQKFYYISNFDRPFDFHVELSKIILEDEAGVEYPVCVKSVGEAPKQFKAASAVAASAANKNPLETLEDEFDIEEPEELDEFGIDVDDFSSASGSKSSEGEESDENDESEEGEEDDEFGELGYGGGSDEYGDRDDY